MIGDLQFKTTVSRKRSGRWKAIDIEIYESACETCSHRWDKSNYCGETTHGRAKSVNERDYINYCSGYQFHEWNEKENAKAREECRNKAYTLAYDTDLEKPKGFFDELFDDEHEYDDPWKKADDDDLEWH